MQLTSLSLSAGITAEGLKRLPTMEKVVDLGLGGDHFTRDMVSLVPHKFPNAVKLDFNHPNKLKDADLAPLAELKHAEVLVLSGAVGLGDGIGKVAAQMKNLQHLKRLKIGEFNRQPKITDAGLKSLAELKGLTQLWGTFAPA